jgi:ACR3 family arsenite transporter
MELAISSIQESTVEKRLNPFERYLTLWVALCMVVGVALGKWAPGAVHARA